MSSKLLPRLVAVVLILAVSGVFLYRNELREIRQTMLSSEAAQGNIAAMKVLLWLGADVNSSESPEGINALSSAAFNRRKEPVEFLISRGADPNHIDSRNALGTTAYFGYLETATALLDAGADVNASLGESALVIASQWGHNELVRLFIDRGADLDRDGEDAIKKALIAGHPEVVDLLIERGVRVGESPAGRGSTWLEYAGSTLKKEHRARMIESLRRAGAKE